jgi:hypothetical protein
MDGAAGVWRSGGSEAPRASAIPPKVAIDNKPDSTQSFMVFIAPLLASPPRQNIASACK